MGSSAAKGRALCPGKPGACSCQEGADILGEICGFAVNGSPEDMANPGLESMVQCMQTAVEESGLRQGEIGYLNAHATGTIRGDVAECEAVERVFGRDIPVSSLKGHMGHTMAACGGAGTHRHLPDAARGPAAAHAEFAPSRMIRAAV